MATPSKAPSTTQGLYPDILNALQNAARRRGQVNRLLEEQRAEKPNPQGYQKLRKRLKKTKFIPPLDADTTQANIYYIRKRFMR